MSTFFGHPALALLARRKFRGALRKTVRRLRTVKGAVLTLLGVVLIGMWISYLLASTLHMGRIVPDPDRLLPKVQLAGLVLVLLNFSSALQHRGLFLPPDEIERLFSAPVRPSDLIRYRIFATSGRSIFGGVVIGFMAMRHMPQPLLAFLGIFLGVMTIPLLHQCVAILAGGIEARFAERLRVLARVGFFVILIGGGLLMMGLLMPGDSGNDTPFVRLLANVGGAEGLDPLSHPAVRAIGAPFRPWARMITAPSPLEFLVWFLVCGGIWVFLFEFTARLPLDFRELSLETSAHVAARLRRVSRGGGAAAGKASARLAAWRIPWFFGRGPAGAVAWRKTGSILRKAKGALWMSSLILVFITILSTVIVSKDDPRSTVFAAAMIAGLGTLYMCSGLRFDFRDELDRMDVIKTWPVAPARLFAAMLLPEVALVSVLLMGAVGLRVALTAGAFPPEIVLILLLLPLFVLAWVGLDNAVFLFLPIRMTPGQDGALQNAGRGMLMMLLRFLMLGAIVLVGGGFAVGVYFLAANVLGVGDRMALAAAGAAAWGSVLAVDLGVIWLGGVTLRRFDVARDRG